MIIDRFEIRVKNTVSLKLRVEHLNYPVSLRLSHLWSLFARKYAKDDRVFMGIMNEPHNLDIKLINGLKRFNTLSPLSIKRAQPLNTFSYQVRLYLQITMDTES